MTDFVTFLPDDIHSTDNCYKAYLERELKLKNRRLPDSDNINDQFDMIEKAIIKRGIKIMAAQWAETVQEMS